MRYAIYSSLKALAKVKDDSYNSPTESQKRKDNRYLKNCTRYISTIVAILMLSTACEEIIEFRGDDTEPKLVIYSLFEEGSEISLSLTRSYAIFDPVITQAPINNAVVKLYSNGTYLTTLTHVPEPQLEEGLPPSAFSNYIAAGITPDPGNLYRIEVSVPGLPDAWSEVTLPPVVAIENIDTIIETRVFSDIYNDFDYYYNERVIKANVRFTDPHVTDNYYRIVVRYTSGRYSGPKNEPFDAEMPVVVHTGLISSPAHNDPVVNPGRDDDFFSSGSENRYSVFTDELIAGKEYEIKLSMSFGQLDTTYYEFRNFEVEFQSLTKELYLYLLSSSVHNDSKDNPLAEPVIVYSNVNNGLGLVGAVSTSRSTIKYGPYPVDGVKYETSTGYR